MISNEIEFNVISGSKDIRSELMTPGAPNAVMMQKLLEKSITAAIGVDRLGLYGGARFARIGDPMGFREARADPNYDVRHGRLRGDQSFHQPAVTLATHKDRLVGYAHAAGNVSGSNAAVRFLKHHGHARNYTWFREIAVDPEYQHQGIGAGLGALTLMSVDPDLRNPVSAHVITEAPAVNAFFDSLPDELKVVRDEEAGPDLGEGMEPLRVRPIVIPDSRMLFVRLNAIASGQ
ncbi:MAG: hypothetical protein JWM37_831 [Candidatus Saccharibacteria bacterium]|nr:hypothetical protein [Candidatus Saccharibacteria bacterium]